MTSTQCAIRQTIVENTEVAESQAGLGLGARLQRLAYHALFRGLVGCHNVVLRLGRAMASHPRRLQRPPKRLGILLTGRFESDNWARAHLAPLAAAACCREVVVVSTYPIPLIPKVRAVYPPQWLVRCCGKTVARLLVFVWHGLRYRPEYVGGFHMLVNGLVATALAPWVGARSIYFCVGGPKEFIDGGIHSGEGGPFVRMGSPDTLVERLMLDAIRSCSLTIVMGSGARDTLRALGIESPIHVVSGGLATNEFHHEPHEKDCSLIVVARLVPIKRIDVLLKGVALASRHVTDLTLTIVGDGPLRQSLGQLAAELGIGNRVHFVGHQKDVGNWLRRSRVFVLTSDSEGLSLSMMEAMTCGLPVVVSDVGDLRDMVIHGVNGYLVPRRCPEALAEHIVELLQNDNTYAAFSQEAADSARRYEMSVTTQRWQAILTRQAGSVALDG